MLMMILKQDVDDLVTLKLKFELIVVVVVVVVVIDGLHVDLELDHDSHL